MSDQEWRAIERDAIEQAALRVLGDPSASAGLKATARERLLRAEGADPAGIVAALRPAQVRALRKLIRGVLDGSIVLDDDA